MDISHGLYGQAFWLILRLRAIYSAVGERGGIELLQICGCELLQRDIPDVGLNMYSKVSSHLCIEANGRND